MRCKHEDEDGCDGEHTAAVHGVRIVTSAEKATIYGKTNRS
jgi:hypothetical protein